MSLNYRLEQDRARTDIEKNIAVDQALVILKGYLITAVPYDKIEILVKQNGTGFTVRKINTQQAEINFTHDR